MYKHNPINDKYVREKSYKRSIIRKKILVIPYTFDNRFLFVKDKTTSEWGFISGGIKRNESPVEASNRELFEETSGLLYKIPKCATKIEFMTYYRPYELLQIDKKRNEIVKSIYTIFMYPINKCNIDLTKFRSNREVSDIKICEYENVGMKWELCSMVYNFIKNEIIF